MLATALIFFLLSLGTALPVSRLLPHPHHDLLSPSSRHLCPVVLQGDLGRTLQSQSLLQPNLPLHHSLRQEDEATDESDEDDDEETPGVRAIEYMVALESADAETKFCSGSLISPKWLLTIASCAIDRTWRARIGGTLSDDGIEYRIRKVINHEQYDVNDRQSPYDIALVELDGQAPPNSSFVHIYDNATLPNAGSFAREISYSDFNENTDRVGLLQLDFPIYLPELCRRLYEVARVDANITQEKGFVCAGYENINRCRVCTDRESQGGPLVQFDESGDIPIQIAITTFFSLELCFGNLPGVFLQVAPLVEWIESKNVPITKTSSSKLVYADGSNEVSALINPGAGVLEIPNTSKGDPGAEKPWVKYFFITIGVAIPLIAAAAYGVRWQRRKVEGMAYMFAEPQPDSHVRSGSLMSDIYEVHSKTKIRDSFSEEVEPVDSGDDDEQDFSTGAFSAPEKPSDADQKNDDEKKNTEEKS